MSLSIDIERLIDEQITLHVTTDGDKELYVRSDEAADAIITLFREALLSDEALRAAIESWDRDINTSGINGGDLAVYTIEAALDAITKES